MSKVHLLRHEIFLVFRLKQLRTLHIRITYGINIADVDPLCFSVTDDEDFARPRIRHIDDCVRYSKY